MGTPVGESGLSPQDIQSRVMAFTSTYVAVVAQAFDELEAVDGSLETRRLLAEGRIGFVANALDIATSKNPITALLDMTVMVSLQRRVWDAHWRPERFPNRPGERMSERLELLETQIWAVAATVLDERAQGALAEIIERVRELYPDQVYVSSLRLSEFAEAREESLLEVPGARGLLNLIGLDPLANLSSTTRQIAEGRLLAERVYFYAARMPYLIKWQAQDLLLDAMADPDVRAVLAVSEQVSEASSRIAGVAEELTARMTDEREAAIDQVFAGIASEREATIAWFEQERDGLRTGIAELTGAVEAATRLSASMKETLAEGGRLAADIRGMSRPDARPFDITEFESAAIAATEGVRELQVALGSVQRIVDGTSADDGSLRVVIDQGTAGLGALIDKAFWRVLILMAAGSGCLLVVLVLNRRLARGRGRVGVPSGS